MRFATIWGEAEIREMRDVTPSVREFTLAPLGRPAARFRPGAHLDVSLLIGERPDTRSYSLIGRSGEACYRVAVKKRDDSRGGSLAMWRLKPGARINISEPIDSFSIEPGRSAYLLIAGGIGITPLVGMAEELAAMGADVRLLHAARKPEECAYAGELGDCLGERYRRFSSSNGERLDLTAAFSALAPGGLATICGPMPMLDGAKRAWAALGRPAADLRWETFGSSGNLPTERFLVKLPRFGREIEVPPSRSLLEALEEAGIEVISDCRRGECGLCAVDVLGCIGTVDHRDVFFSEHQKKENQKLCACVSRAVGVVTIDTAYRPD